MKQRRKHKRKHITATALIRPLKGKAADYPFNGLVMNISLGGAEFSATESIKPGEDFEAVLWFIDEKGVIAGEETVQGVALWEKKMPPFYMFGVKFSGLNQKDHPELIQHIKATQE